MRGTGGCADQPGSHRGVDLTDNDPPSPGRQVRSRHPRLPAAPPRRKALCNSRGLWDTSKPPDQSKGKRTSRSAPRRTSKITRRTRTGDNEYQARIYGTHQDGGCTGNAVDVVVRVRDIAPQEVREPMAQFRQGSLLNILVEWNPPPHNRLERAAGIAPRRELSGGVPPGR